MIEGLKCGLDHSCIVNLNTNVNDCIDNGMNFDQNIRNFDGIKNFVNRAELDIFDCDEVVTIRSNPVVTRKVSVTLEKCQSKRCVVEGDKQHYTVKIKNCSGFDLENAIFKDFIPNGMQFIQGSFKVNGRCENPCINGRVLEFKLCRVPNNENVIVEFDMEVL